MTRLPAAGDRVPSFWKTSVHFSITLFIYVGKLTVFECHLMLKYFLPPMVAPVDRLCRALTQIPTQNMYSPLLTESSASYTRLV